MVLLEACCPCSVRARLARRQRAETRRLRVRQPLRPRRTSCMSASSPSRGADDPTDNALVRGQERPHGRERLGHVPASWTPSAGMAVPRLPPPCLFAERMDAKGKARTCRREDATMPLAKLKSLPDAASFLGTRASRPSPGRRAGRPGASGSGAAERRAGFSGLRSLRSLRPENPPLPLLRRPRQPPERQATRSG